MTADQYRARVLAQLDAMRTTEKEQLILGLIAALYPNGDPDHEVSGSDFIAEAIRLLTSFHPGQLLNSTETANYRGESNAPEF